MNKVFVSIVALSFYGIANASEAKKIQDQLDYLNEFEIVKVNRGYSYSEIRSETTDESKLTLIGEVKNKAGNIKLIKCTHNIRPNTYTDCDIMDKTYTNPTPIVKELQKPVFDYLEKIYANKPDASMHSMIMGSIGRMVEEDPDLPRRVGDAIREGYDRALGYASARNRR